MEYKKRIEEYVKRFDVEGFGIVKTTIEKIFSPWKAVGEDSYKEIFIITLAKWGWMMRQPYELENVDPFDDTEYFHSDTCGLCVYFRLVNYKSSGVRNLHCKGCPLNDSFFLKRDVDCCKEYEAYINSPSRELATSMYKRIEKEFLYRFPVKKLV